MVLQNSLSANPHAIRIFVKNFKFFKTGLLSSWKGSLWKWESLTLIIQTASSEFGTYRLCEQRRFRRACASAQSRQNLRCSLIQAVCQEEPSDRKPDPWPLWMAGHAQLKFVMMECSKTQIRLAGLLHQGICTKNRAFSWADLSVNLMYLYVFCSCMWHSTVMILSLRTP